MLNIDKVYISRYIYFLEDRSKLLLWSGGGGEAKYKCRAPWLADDKKF